jgi:hypothetical protein
LNAAAKFGAGERDVFCKQESCKKGDRENNQESRNVWAYRYNFKIEHPLIDNKIVANKIQKDIQDGVESACGSISECFKGNKFSERAMEIVDKLNDI